MTELTDRQDRIREIVSSHINMESLSILKNGIDFPIKAIALRKHLWDSTRPCGGAPVPFCDLISLTLMSLREESLVSACPNSQFRRTRGLDEWNNWVNGVGDDCFKPPVFGYPGGHIRSLVYDYMADFTESDFDKLLSDAASEISSGMNLYVNPVLGREISTIPSNKYGAPSPRVINEKTSGHRVLDSIEGCAVARHMVVELPSRELVIGNFLPLKGISEGLAVLAGRDDYDLNDAGGVDACMRDCIQKTGMAMIRILGHGATENIASPMKLSPAGEGIQHMSQERNFKGPGYSISFTNCIADPETMIDIMMASGIYDHRKYAGRSLDDFIMESDAERIAMPDVERLHVYAPTGFLLYELANSMNNFYRSFQANDIKRNEDIIKKYTFSTYPLSIPEHDPNEELRIVEQDTWCRSGQVALEAGNEVIDDVLSDEEGMAP